MPEIYSGNIAVTSISAASSVAGVYNVESYGAVPCAYFTDGSVISATSAFTSSTANFTSSDVGAWVCIEKAGASQFRRLVSQIGTVVSSTVVTLTNNAGRTQDGCRFYISRGGNALSAFQAAVDAAAAAGGGKVLFEGTYEFGSGSLVLKNKVYLEGVSRQGSMIFQQGGLTNQGPIIRNDYTSQQGAQFTGCLHFSLEGNSTGNSSANAATTLSAAYTAGATTVNVTSAASFTPSGFVRLVSGGTTTYFYYTSITTGGGAGGTDLLNGVVGGQNGYADASAASAGSTVTCQSHCGIFYSTVPYANSPSGSGAAQYHDPYHVIEDVAIARVRGAGIGLWSQSETRVRNCFIYSCEFIGITYGFDTFVDSVTVDGAGYAGFIIRNSIGMTSNCKSFSCGTVDSTRGPGFLVQGFTNVETGSHTLSACIAQDNFSEGFKLLNAQRVIMTGCQAASNSCDSVGTFPGVKVDGCTNCLLDFTSTEDKHNSSTAFQQNAVEMLNTSITSQNNDFRLSHGCTSAVSAIGPAIKSGSIVTGGHRICINGSDYFYGSDWTPADHGLQMCSMDDPAVVRDVLTPITAGVMYVAKLKMPHDVTVANVKLVITTAFAGGGQANTYISVHDSTGAYIGRSADLSTGANFTATGERTVAISLSGTGTTLSFTGGPNNYLYVALLVGTQAATPLQVRAGGGASSVTSNFGQSGATLRSGSTGAGLTAPAAFTPSGLTAAIGPILFGIT